MYLSSEINGANRSEVAVNAILLKLAVTLVTLGFFGTISLILYDIRYDTERWNAGTAVIFSAMLFLGVLMLIVLFIDWLWSA